MQAPRDGARQAAADPDPASLRARTYLAPGIPLAFFELVVELLAERLGRPLSLESDARTSGPMQGDADPFGAAEIDLAFLCSPSFLYLRAQPLPSVELLPAGFVFGDARNAGRPLTWSDVVVHAQHPARSFADLADSVWGYNDNCSLSGFFSTLQELARLGADAGYFERWVRTGSHLASLEAVLEGRIDGAAIDSVGLALQLRERPELARRLRVIASFGPFPIQPVVVRSSLAPELRARIAAALLELGPARDARFERFGLEACVPIDESAFGDERLALCSLGCLPG